MSPINDLAPIFLSYRHSDGDTSAQLPRGYSGQTVFPSVQAQILNLFLELEQLGVAYLFISHGIDVVRHMSHRVAVQRQGEVIKEGPVAQVSETPIRPYTQALLRAVPHSTRWPRPARRQRPQSPQHNVIFANRIERFASWTSRTDPLQVT